MKPIRNQPAALPNVILNWLLEFSKSNSIKKRDSIKIRKSWTLFLDRDGVINQRIPDAYISSIKEFQFIPGSLEAIVEFTKRFNRIIVVTNQQGIGKGLMTTAQLNEVHQYMLHQVANAGGYIDKVYCCAELKKGNPLCRKPNTGMGLQAKADFPDIDFEKSIMVGDSISDMEFAKRLGMKTVFITTKEEERAEAEKMVVDLRLGRLRELAGELNFE